MVLIKVLPLSLFVQQFGGWFGWAKSFFARAYVEPVDNPMLPEIKAGTIVVLKGSEGNKKLMAHEFLHTIGIDHPEDRAGKTDGSLLARIKNKIFCAASESFPISSAWAILRWSDPENALDKWENEPKVWL